jgi:glycosyltransferase involved in cell wall biosynthesis
MEGLVGSLMRICFITNRPAWPLYPGFKRRAGMVLQALAELGEVDVLMALPDQYPTVPCPPEIDPTRVTVIDVPRPSKPTALRQWAFGQLPLSMTSVTWGAAAPEVRRHLESKPYDVVWVLAGTAWPLVAEIAGSMPRTRFVVDLDDLEDDKIRHRQENTAWDLRDPRATALRAVDLVDLKRWEKLHREVFSKADAVTVCSADDTAKLATRYEAVLRRSARAHAVPNGYATPDVIQVEEDLDTAQPVLLFVGDLTYRPNEEAARFLCERVLPIVRKTHPTARVRLVGPQGAVGPTLANIDGVEAIGIVESIEPEMRQATASCAPLLSGGGTRIKIIEAFAFGVPVVATTIGAEGLATTHDVELLIGDTPEAFATACCRLIAEPETRMRLRVDARRVFERSFTAAAVRDAASSVLRSVVGSAESHDGRIIHLSGLRAEN